MLEGLQVAQKTAEEEARTAREQLRAQARGASKEAEMHEDIREMRQMQAKQMQHDREMRQMQAEQMQLTQQTQQQQSQGLQQAAQVQQQVLSGQQQQSQASQQAARMQQQVLSDQQQQGQALRQAVQLLGELAMDEQGCPSVPWLQPAETNGTLGTRLKSRLKPKSWMTKEFRLYFLCPVTCAKAETNDGKGYLVELPKDWVVKYGPALKMGVKILKLALATGRIAGLPLPCMPDMRELIHQAEIEAVNQLQDLIEDAVTKVAATKEAGANKAGEFATEFEAAMKLDAEPVQGVQAEKVKHATGASFRALRALVEKQDPLFQHTGLSKVLSRADNSLEWVSADGSADFHEQGQRAILAVAQE